ncbi:oxidoreductase [Desulfoluna limicola]|uniref:Oxidoreductase n=1 Tax=Desulfoluna limicola TaxID=2810562 RepID=A0ABN6F9K9_9BACT|nr:ferric reductase-like transmembrane domain-containing protein [Desulfoluna limicola]BCS98906.1 oxidoreductase [Desulfoluna limicola]
MTIKTATFWSRNTRLSTAAGCVAVLILLFCGAFAIPFVYESFSIKYKFGLHKALLRSGKLVGMAAALLLVAQLLLVARITWVNRMAGMDRLIAVHKYNGIAIALLALMHPLLVFGPEEITTLPLEFKFWPEIVGAGLLMGLFYMTTAALFKKALGLPFHLWMRAHKIGGCAVLLALFVHLLFSSETFEGGLPRVVGIAFSVLCLVVLISRHAPPFRNLSTWIVTDVTPAGNRATRIRLTPDNKETFTYLPGQFAFLSFPSSVVSSEAHPFTIASSPATPTALEFIIGKGGDWTRYMDRIQQGAPAVLDGPYGSFSHLMLDDDAPLVLIAGGVGITPMLSMMRHMDATDDGRKVILVWSNRSHEALFSADELIRMKMNHPSLSVHLHFTDEPGAEQLTTQQLHHFIEDLTSPQVFLCGPPPMMTAVKGMLREIGIHRHRVHTETFGF